MSITVEQNIDVYCDDCGQGLEGYYKNGKLHICICDNCKDEAYSAGYKEGQMGDDL